MSREFATWREAQAYNVPQYAAYDPNGKNQPMTTQLPDKLSDLLRLAVHDAQACEADPRYTLNMRRWHQIDVTTKKCNVCLAGAVIAKTLHVEPHVALSPYMLNREQIPQINAIDAARESDLWLALSLLADGNPRPRSSRQATIVSQAATRIKATYGNTAESRADWASYLEAADMLAAVGL